MTETQLFYLTIMIALLIIYLIIVKICESIQSIAKYHSMASMKNVTRVDCDNPEDFQRVIQEINEAINKEEK